MDASQIASLAAALTGLLAGGVAAYRAITGDRFKRKVDQAAGILTNYTDQIDKLRDEMEADREAHTKEIERMQRQHQAEIDRIQNLHDSERARWDADRRRQDERLAQLEAQVTALMFRVPTSKDRKTDRES